jgi:hypothetical protein
MTNVTDIGEFLDKKPRQRPKRFEKDPDDARPIVRINAENVNETVAAAATALRAAELGIYQRGHKIVYVSEELRPTAEGPEVEAQVIRERGEHALVCDLARTAIFVKFDARAGGDAPIEPPLSLVRKLREQVEELNLPILAGVVNTPILRRDGGVLDTPGYDPASGLLFDPLSVEFPPIPLDPTHADALRAKDFLLDLIKTFPFVSPIDQSVALSLILTAVARDAIDAAPMHATTAPVAGSGKSKLIDVACVVATGREAGVIAEGYDEAETEKRLSAELFAGTRIIAIDNVQRALGGQFLCQVLTQSAVKPRILGKSETMLIPNRSLVTATGNNLTLAGDLTRRAVICRLDPKCEQPELRPFDFDPVTRAKEHRPQLIAAVLTILRAFKLHGKPSGKPALGSFEQCSALVRDSLWWLGLEDPTKSIQAVREADPELRALKTVATQWAAAIGQDRVTVAQVVDYSLENSDLREALIEIAGERGLVNNRRLGRWLSKNENRIVDGRCFQNVGDRSGVAVWQLAT